MAGAYDMDYTAAIGEGLAATGVPEAPFDNAAAGVVPYDPTDALYNRTGTYKDVTINGVTYHALDSGSVTPPPAGGMGTTNWLGNTISGTTRDKQFEAEALKLGYSPEYLAARGGINQYGYYNDVALTDQNYKHSYADMYGNTLDFNALINKINTAGTGSIDQIIKNLNALMSGLGQALTLVASSSSGGGSASSSGGGAGTAPAPAAKTMIGTKIVHQKGGVVQTVAMYSDGTTAVIDENKDFSARDAVMRMFENTGLGSTFIQSLMDSIDKVYQENAMPTDSQILNSIYTSDAYKTRFAANEAIRQRMADGKGRPGDRLLSPYEYIQTENQYRTILSEAGLPEGFYDQQEDFTKFIENSISAAELTDRVNIAKQALYYADGNTVKALQDYYGLSTGDLTAYMLDKDRAFNLIDSRFKYTTEEAKKLYTSAEIGGAALRAGVMSDKQFAEEIYMAGKSGQAEGAFQQTARDQKDYMRLTGIYGEQGGAEDLTRESLALAGGTDVTLKTKRLASKERATFSQKSALDQSSLGRRRFKTSDV